jgi:serine phosphatase RsbU (regulator of sigma subunit)
MPLADGDILLAVGDVAGHELTAAAEMIRMRYAMASLALACREPAGLLDRLNTALFRRSESMDQAINGLAALAAAVHCCPAGLLDHVNYDAADDDACVMVAERVR